MKNYFKYIDEDKFKVWEEDYYSAIRKGLREAELEQPKTRNKIHRNKKKYFRKNINEILLDID